MVAQAPDPASAFVEYAQQALGVPWATLQDKKILRREIANFFEHYPQADFYTLCRIVQYCRKNKRRPERAWKVISYFRFAWRDGYLPELTPGYQREDNVEERIAAALEVERDPGWRNRLLGASGVEARREAIAEWEAG